MEAATSVGEIRAGNLEIRPAEFLVSVDRRPLVLTVREFGLLLALARRQGHVLTREELYAVVWRQPFRPAERAVDVYVAKLRQKLESAAPDWQYIHTHFGIGYRFDPQRSTPEASQPFHIVGRHR